MRSTTTISIATIVCTLLLATSAAFADEDDVEKAGNSHRGQVGVSVQLGTGYRVLFPYNEEYCGQLTSDGGPKSVCTGRSPFFVDFGLSYGVSSAIELIAELRLGMEDDFEGRNGHAGPKALAYAAGVRIFVDAEGQLKFFSTLEGVIESTDYSQTTAGNGGVALENSADFGFRNVNGVLFDLHRTFGIYAHFGETATFSNWLRFELHGGLGVQARFP